MRKHWKGKLDGSVYRKFAIYPGFQAVQIVSDGPDRAEHAT